jgi:signal transduction histidine kinase
MLSSVPTQPTIMSGDAPADIARDIAAIQRMDVLPTLLDVLCDLTGMGFAAVARVTEGTWTACAVKDNISLGIGVGGQLPIETTLCLEAKHLNGPIVSNDLTVDPRYATHPTPKTYHIKGYISVPIVLNNGRYFGSLCAVDSAPADIDNEKVMSIFKRFASVIAVALHNQESQARDLESLATERARSELREQFIAILGHDLRNPLQAVLASSELLVRRADDPAKVQQLAKRINSSAKRMWLLIDDVLDFARGKLGGGMGVQIGEPADVTAALETVVRELQDVHPDRQIIETIDPIGLIRCDLSRVQQMASNLLANALVHGAPDSPVKIAAYLADQHFVFEVWNGGAPIPAESVVRIFEPFWRSSASVSGQGLGLGLHICHQIVRAHQGDITVTSTADEGTRFTVRLPLL